VSGKTPYTNTKVGRQSEYEFAKRNSSSGRKQHTAAEFSVVLTEDVCGHIFVICGTVLGGREGGPVMVAAAADGFQEIIKMLGFCFSKF
jgi:hypothetical protein